MDSNDIYQVSEKLRHESRSIYNRLRSIDADAEFVTHVSEMLSEYPVIANERCGVWYVDPQIAHPDSVYFKSTDGHTGNWKFSLRRANTHIFPILNQHKGCILVDSTRKGKRMPDSFSRTIPIWCAVWNTAVQMLRGTEWDCKVYTPPRVVSESENSHMSNLVPAFADMLLQSGIDVRGLTQEMCKPVRPIWITRDHRLTIPPDFSEAEFCPIICVSASSTRDCSDGFMYVQGAADDHELWAGKLTPQLFWQHREQLLSNKNTAEIVDQVVSIDQDVQRGNGGVSFIRNTNVAVGAQVAATSLSGFDAVISCGEKMDSSERHLRLSIHDSKKGQTEMAIAIPQALQFVEPFMRNNSRILVQCAQGTNLSVSIALAILTKYTDDNGQFQINERNVVSKQMIQNRLLWITTSHAKATSGSLFERALGLMQNEWRRMEHERMEWEVERIRLKAKISASEKRIAQLSTLYTVSQKHVVMLETMLKGGAKGEVKQAASDVKQAANEARQAVKEVSGIGVADIVEVTRGTRERGRKLLEQCMEEIEALTNGIDLQPPEIMAAPLEALRRGEFGSVNAKGDTSSAGSLGVAKDADEPRLNGIIESDRSAGESLALASVHMPKRMSDDEESQPEQRPIRRISEQRRRRRLSLTVDEVDSGGAQWHETRVLAGHMDCVRAISARADVMASAADDGLVVIWDLAQKPRARARDMAPKGICRGHLAAATSVVLGTDVVYAGGLDSSVRAWTLPADSTSTSDDVDGVFPAREFVGHTDAVWSLALASRVSLLASASADATCRIWSVDSRMSSAPLRATWTSGTRVPTCVSFADDGARLAIGYDSGTVDVRDLAAANTPVTFDCGSRITSIARHDAVYAVACVSGTVHLCDSRTGASVLSTGIGAYPRPNVVATAVDISANSAVVTGGSDGVVKWWDWRRPLTSVCEVKAHKQKADEGVCAVAYAAGGVLSAGADGLIRLFQQQIN
ncbi:tRNA A64-2'-O-ribosylphosphate transferase [Coemansia sp. RSA 1822]|nr:tRNA A64-2'-O-ribosylphosphate transferase [Coemansia sp. RSA 1822]